MVNGMDAPYTLAFYLGVDDPRTLTPDAVKTVILTPVLQDGPVMLKASDFNIQQANTNSTAIGAEIDGKIFKLSRHQLCASVFNELCPGYSNQPQTKLKHIKQSFLDGKENLFVHPSLRIISA